MNVAGSLFSGIGGLDHGLARAGWEHAFFCEADAYRRDVLRARWPGVPVYEDVASVATSDNGARPVGVGAGRRALGGSGRGATADGSLGGSEDAVDLLAGGFPCQDLSVAGRRAGLAGERSGLFHEFARVAESFRPRWLLVENVPGLLSSNGGRDFGVVLGTLADLGYGLAWRIVDSRFFGVPQRRRRVFVVGALVDRNPRAAAERAGAVLAVGTRCERHPATRREAGADVAGTLGGGAGERGWAQDTERMTFVAETVRSHPRPGSNSNGNLVTAFHALQDPISETELAPSWGKGNREGTASIGIAQGASVRRLTPTECERLQALPDGWSDLGGTPDSRRYAALGDAVTASVAEWIGRRILDDPASNA
jgi:DNA (cytosine-5)-methyltransferase 1